MRKLLFNLNRLFVKEREDQKVNLPPEKDLNEQELTIVTGGMDGYRRDHDDYRYYRRHDCR